MRAFIAVVPDPPTLEFLRGCERHLLRQAWARDVRWVHEPGWHLTLRFLGEIEPSQAQHALARLEVLAQDLRAFDAQLTLPRWFPNPSKPRVVAALAEDTPALQRLFRACEAVAEEIGCAPERRGNHGHITFGRCREGFGRGATLAMPGEPAVMRVNQVVAFKSDLTPNGAIHTPLGRIALSPELCTS